ncbi:unnamed protein product [Lota lota]
MSAKDPDCFELEKTTDPNAEEGQSFRPVVQPLANGVRGLSTISEQELDLSPQGGGGGGDVWDRSSLSLASDRRYGSSNSCLATDDSYQPAPGDCCAAMVLSCLHCRFRELAVALPEACGVALRRLFPSCTHTELSGETEPPGGDWCGCKALELDCSGCHSCQDTAELLELAMEISEVRPGVLLDRGQCRSPTEWSGAGTCWTSAATRCCGGHAGEPEELGALGSRPGPVKRLGVIDETVDALYGARMALMKHRGLFELLEAEGPNMLSSRVQSPDCIGVEEPTDAATESTRVAIETMWEELAPNLWEDDLDRLVDFGHLISPELEMVNQL